MLVKIDAGIAAGCAEDAYRLGTLLRHGRALPGNIVEQDMARAERLIESYARTGYVSAFADLAEMALAQEDARSAMKWTQVYLYFRPEPGDKTTRGKDFDRRGYNANLLSRADAAWRSAGLTRGAITPLFNDYLNANRASVLAGLSTEFKSGPPEIGRLQDDPDNSPALVSKNLATVVDVGYMTIRPGYANFLVEVQPDGHVSRIVAETFGPSADTPAALKPLIAGVSFEPFEASEPQIVRIPVVFGYSDGGPAIKTKPKRPRN